MANLKFTSNNMSYIIHRKYLQHLLHYSVKPSTLQCQTGDVWQTAPMTGWQEAAGWQNYEISLIWSFDIWRIGLGLQIQITNTNITNLIPDLFCVPWWRPGDCVQLL